MTSQIAESRGQGAGSCFLTDDTVEITVFNRGITLLTSDDERVQRIHRVLCRLDKE
jgi:hypothetical protein